jgi:hypothetical protein
LLSSIDEDFILTGGTKGITRSISPDEWNPGNQPINYYVGNSAHRKIGAYYRFAHLGTTVYTNTIPIKSILKDQQTSPNGLKKAELDQRPDILDWPQKYIYEIKPRGRIAEGIKQLNKYINIFKKAKVTLQPGPVEEQGTYGLEPFPGGLFVFGAPQKGVILFRSYRRNRDTDVDPAKVTRDNILEAMAIGRSGFPDDIFEPTPVLTPAPNNSSEENTPSFEIPPWLVPPIFRNPSDSPIWFPI